MAGQGQFFFKGTVMSVSNIENKGFFVCMNHTQLLKSRYFYFYSERNKYAPILSFSGFLKKLIKHLNVS